MVVLVAGMTEEVVAVVRTSDEVEEDVEEVEETIDNKDNGFVAELLLADRH